MTENLPEGYTTDKLSDIAPRKTAARNYGIDLLRIVAMAMIVVLHVLGRGGIVKNTEPFTLRYEICWIMEMFCFIGVNLYALISGYAGLYSKYKPHKLITMWLQVELITWISVAIGYKTGVITLDRPIIYFMPITFNGYWYFTAYAGLFLFIPLLNKAILELDKKTLDRFLIFSSLAVCIFGAFTETNGLGLKRGYSTIFLMLLYLVGGYLRKYDVPHRFGKLQLLSVFTISFILTVIGKNIAEKNDEKIVELTTKNVIFNSYNNILFVISAVFLLMFFSKLDIKSKPAIKLIGFFAPLTFGIYIVHLSPTAWYYLKDATKYLLDKRILLMLVGIVLFTLGIFFASALAEYIRALIFRLLKIDKLCEHFYSLLCSLWSVVKRAAYGLYKVTAPKQIKSKIKDEE